jgi:hypothetical protein
MRRCICAGHWAVPTPRRAREIAQQDARFVGESSASGPPAPYPGEPRGGEGETLEARSREVGRSFPTGPSTDESRREPTYRDEAPDAKRNRDRAVVSTMLRSY